MDIQRNNVLQEKNENTPICAEDVEAEVFRAWEGLNLYSNHLFEIVCNATPNAKCLFGYGYDGFCFYIPAANKYYHVWRDGNFYHDYYLGKEELQKGDILEILHNNTDAVNPSKNGLKAESIEEIIHYVISSP